VSDLYPGICAAACRVADGVDIAYRTLGAGPPLLLLHGFPQTHAIWHRVAPALAAQHTLVLPDLRGYGDSCKPPTAPDHAPYSKRAMAADLVVLMTQLGHARYDVCGHDRGGRVAHRLALDHPQAVRRLMLLDISPTRTMYQRTTMEFARAYYHWFFLIQPAPFPETLIGANPEVYLRHHMGGRHAGLEPFMPDAWPEYLRCFSDPACIHATCEDYRAAESIDIEHDEADLDRRIEVQFLVLWGRHGMIERCFDGIADWRERAPRVQGHALDCGHYLPEERPDETAQALATFFS
jgi:haloacetate dehalogenase